MGYNILIADDSETVRGIIAKTLALSGVEVGAIHQAANGEEALAIIAGSPVDIVFTDINMPVMTGIQMVERIRANPDWAALPVVVISTEGSRTRIEDLLARGVQAYIRKPFTPELLREVVEKLLGARHG
jgi:two-component system chemotaxis response regulator CheY